MQIFGTGFGVTEGGGDAEDLKFGALEGEGAASTPTIVQRYLLHPCTWGAKAVETGAG
ncbi:MAG TPA: hypothetical protein VMI32_17770 [Candidatus Solibacter sp.]|nr:hypothetical protein [Candidatus Solibacter sp.]